MSITYNESTKTFLLNTKNSSYAMKIPVRLSSPYVLRLLCAGYGFGLSDSLQDRGFSPNPFEAGNDRCFSLDFLPQEFSTSESGDYRSGSIEVENRGRQPHLLRESISL